LRPRSRWRRTTCCLGSGTSCSVVSREASQGLYVVAIDPGTLFTIVLMALATYATRAGGLWLASRFDLSERAGAWLDQIPGAILVSLVAPIILMGGPIEVFAALAVVIVSLRTGSLPAAMVTGVGTVLALRALEANLL
jgi:uncharacterized membrane protein